MVDRIIIGAGIYGLYAAIVSASKGYNVLVIDRDDVALNRGSFINQARLHSGYHYPRSMETAKKSRDYFFRFLNDFADAINVDFKQYYAIAANGSLTTDENFVKFCNNLNIKCDKIDEKEYFNDDMVAGLYDTLEYSVDCIELREILLQRCSNYNNIKINYNEEVVGIKRDQDTYIITTINQDKTPTEYKTKWLLNATYASTNSILSMLDLPLLDIKYELCEVILCAVSKRLKNIGITVMDGQFFSIMPFGNTGLHSITSVGHTPHVTSHDKYPIYECQQHNKTCTGKSLCSCNECEYTPKSKVNEMLTLAKQYLKDDIKIYPIKSLFTVKPILNSCELDDARPTLIKSYENMPNFFTVFSGKLNTIYDLDEVL